MKKGEYLESIGLMTFANHQFLQGNADENYKKMAERLAENLVEIWNENEDREVCNMKEFIEKLIGRLEEKTWYDGPKKTEDIAEINAYKGAIKIVKELAEEYKNESCKGDLISKSAFLKVLNDYVSRAYDCGGIDDENVIEYQQTHDDKSEYIIQGFSEVCGLLEDVPTTYIDGWIPCSERLPESGIHVLCYGKNSLGSFKYEVSVYAEEIECWMCSKIAEVLAWQPLPEPYKEETT